jgi:hypothetical protein
MPKLNCRKERKERKEGGTTLPLFHRMEERVGERRRVSLDRLGLPLSSLLRRMERKKKHVFLCTTILKGLRRLRKFFGARVCDPQQLRQPRRFGMCPSAWDRLRCCGSQSRAPLVLVKNSLCSLRSLAVNWVNMVTASLVAMCSARRRTQRPGRFALPFSMSALLVRAVAARRRKSDTTPLELKSIRLRTQGISPGG